MFIREGVQVGVDEFSIETGRMGKQADGTVIVKYGDSVVLVSVVADRTERDVPFLPLTVEYTERAYAAGRIPGNYFRREGRPATHEILTCRLIDRPIRPLFPENWHSETQIIAMALSTDGKSPPDVLAITGASAALAISDIPWNGPIAGIRVGRVDGKFIVFPTEEQQKDGDLNIVVACSSDALVMVEGACRFVSEKDLMGALAFAKEQSEPILELQNKIRNAVGKEKRQIPEKTQDAELVKKIRKMCLGKVKEAFGVREKQARHDAL
ncbi:MAG: polyribonucleotide nucleotidyltransferase, partial [Pseudomonadota bacterium]